MEGAEIESEYKEPLKVCSGRHKKKRSPFHTRSRVVIVEDPQTIRLIFGSECRRVLVLDIKFSE